MTRNAVLLASLLLASGCALYNEVSVNPLVVLPSNIERGSDIQSMIRKADYLRAIELAPVIESQERPSANDFAALGTACLASGRLDDARRHLRAAIDLKPFRTIYAQVAWDLSRVEYLANNFEASLEWAKLAEEHGLDVRTWHMEYLASLKGVPVYRFGGTAAETVPFRFGHPDVPRIRTRIDGRKEVEGVIDSGAVLSIISRRLADELKVRRLGRFEGTFRGLLGEPIPVTFGLLDRLEIGAMVIENIPVAIMPDDKMRFLVNKREREEFKIDFLLGSNLLKEMTLELDFGRNAARFTRLTPAARNPHPEQNLFFEGFRPHVRGAVNRRGWYLFVLDTGSEVTFLNRSRLDILPVQTFGMGTHTATLQGLGGAMKTGAKLENVEVGVDRWAGIFKTIPMYDSPDQEQAFGIIGQNFLKNFNVRIDFGTMRVELRRR